MAVAIAGRVLDARRMSLAARAQAHGERSERTPPSVRPSVPPAVGGGIVALQRAAGNRAVGRVVAVQRRKEDAQAFITANKLAIAATKADVLAYVRNPANDTVLRQGLLAEWNKNQLAQWLVDPKEVVPSAPPANKYHYSTFDTYKTWTPGTAGVKIPIAGAEVSAHHRNYGPKISSNVEKWPDTKVGDSYAEFIAGLRSNHLTDQQIATSLLNLDDTPLLKTLREKRAYAMITLTAYLAEEYRKQGAAKLYRAVLRAIEAGNGTFDQFDQLFAFASSAEAGREQVANLVDARRLPANVKPKLSAANTTIDPYVSADDDADWMTDAEVAKNKPQTLAKRHKGVYLKELYEKREKEKKKVSGSGSDSE